MAGKFRYNKKSKENSTSEKEVAGKAVPGIKMCRKMSMPNNKYNN